ncbi:hypothetical protein H0H87_004185 [Tephrocybe sp. NHM501043]|nr:hypothetical protein H0H87_004185 [Tephrocybe sp. NHM501043]
MKRTVDIDPLTLAMAPPPNETLAERTAREEQEEHARQVSKRIDHELKLAKTAMKNMQKAVKVLLLGQSMSGKTTTIKNFQMTYAQKSWAEERESWKAVILLNLVRSVNIVVSIVGEECTDTNQDSKSREGPHVALTEHHKNLTLKLAPLRQIQRDLETLLGAGTLEGDGSSDKVRRGQQEFSLRSNSGWKNVLGHIRNPTGGKGLQLQQIASEVIVSLKGDILGIWNDSVVQTILRQRKLRLEHAPADILNSFLHDIDRIIRPEYVPSDADVVRARLRTTGVQEYHFSLDRGTPTALDWFMYDVAGM